MPWAVHGQRLSARQNRGDAGANSTRSGHQRSCSRSDRTRRRCRRAPPGTSPACAGNNRQFCSSTAHWSIMRISSVRRSVPRLPVATTSRWTFARRSSPWRSVTKPASRSGISRDRRGAVDAATHPVPCWYWSACDCVSVAIVLPSMTVDRLGLLRTAHAARERHHHGRARRQSHTIRHRLMHEAILFRRMELQGCQNRQTIDPSDDLHQTSNAGGRHDRTRPSPA